MTLLVILASLVFGGWYADTYHTSVVSGMLTIYVVAFVAGLAMATLAAIIAGRWRGIAAAGVLMASYAGSHLAWTLADPVVALAIVYVITAAYFVLVGRERWEWGIAAVMLLGVASAALTAAGAIPSPFDRPPVYLAWNFADLSSLLGHIASVLLGLGSGDWGKKVRNRALIPVAWARGGSFLMMLRHRSA